MMGFSSTTALSQKSQHSANGARYKSQGQARSASPLVTNQNSVPALKGRIRCVFRPFRPKPFVDVLTRGDALRFASRLPLAFISRAVGALIDLRQRAAQS